MNPILFGPVQTNAVTATVAIEPIYNVLMSLARLTTADIDTEQEPWVAEVAARLTPEQRHHNRLIFEGLGEILLPDAAYADFPSYLDALAVLPPSTLRDRLFRHLSDTVLIEDTKLLLADAQAWQRYLVRCYPNAPADESLQLEIHRLLNDPAALQQLIVTHLRGLWESELADEWAKQLPMMDYVTKDLNARSWPHETATDLIRAFMRCEPPDAIRMQLVGVQHVILVPSPFISLSAARFGNPATIWLFMKADFKTLPMRTEPIKRGEALRPLRALADDMRLRLLEILAAHEEVRTQDIVAQVDVSQPTVSRHLKQLSAAGLITEHRGTDANKHYRLNLKTVDDLCFTLKQLLSPENARLIVLDPRLDQPPALRRFLDRQMRVTDWPSKLKDQRVVLAYLATKFTLDAEYTERAVTDLLGEWHTYGNPAYLRRSLIDEGFLSRTKDGARYWRTASAG